MTAVWQRDYRQPQRGRGLRPPRLFPALRDRSLGIGPERGRSVLKQGHLAQTETELVKKLSIRFG